MKKKMTIVLGGIIVCMLCFASAAHAIVWTAKCTKEANPIRNEFGVFLAQDCVVQVITSESPVIFPPSWPSGNPTGPSERIQLVGLVGSTPDTSFEAGEFNYVIGNIDKTKHIYVYLRAWNSISIDSATKFGNSATIDAFGLGNIIFYNWYPNSFSTTLPLPLPSGPSSLIGTGESTSTIRWTWPAVTGALRYELCTSNGTLITSIEVPSISTVEGIATSPNAAIIREVRAIKAGGPTQWTSLYTAYTLANVPTIGTAKSGWKTGGSYVTVTWTAPGNPALTKYQLQKTNGTPVGTPIINGFTATDANLTETNKLYSYNVKALNGNLTLTATSDSVSATTPPGRPTLEVTGYTTNEITWSWGAVPGKNRYNFYINGSWSSTTEGSVKSASLPCDVNAATVEAVSTANGTGEPAALNKWTLPVVPYDVSGHPATDPSKTQSCDLTWNDSNVNAVYIPEYSLNGVDNFITKEAVTTVKFKDGVSTNYADQNVYWRIRARNGNTPFPGDYSGYSTPYVIIKTSGAGTGGGGNAPIISQVKFNGKAWRPGAVISSRPQITAIVTCDSEVDNLFTTGAVWIDENRPAPYVPFAFDSADVTYEVVPGAPANTWQITIRASQSIPALPVSQHYLKIKVRDKDYTPGEWEGLVGVMSGGVQMIGAAYNYPNPFRPLSSDPNQNTTRISYNLSVDATVTLIIYDITGHEVYRKTSRSGTDGGQAGLNSVPFNGTSMFGEALGNGMYLYKLISGGTVIGSGKLVVLD